MTRRGRLLSLVVALAGVSGAPALPPHDAVAGPVTRSHMIEQLYTNGLARMAKGDPAAAVSVFHVVNEVASELPETHHALAVAELLANFGRRDRALASARRALATDPRNPLFAVVATLADPALAALAADGALLLSDAGAERIRAAVPLLGQVPGAPSARQLATVLRGIERSSDAAMPWRLADFDQMLGTGGWVQVPERREPQAFAQLFAIDVPGERFRAYEPRMLARLQNGLDSLSAANLRHARMRLPGETGEADQRGPRAASASRP